MSDQNVTSEPTVDQERGLFGSAGWDATDEETESAAPDNASEKTPEIPDDVPRPDPDKDQG
jgi:hypothetical protein